MTSGTRFAERCFSRAPCFLVAHFFDWAKVNSPFAGTINESCVHHNNHLQALSPSRELPRPVSSATSRSQLLRHLSQPRVYASLEALRITWRAVHSTAMQA